MSDDDDELGDFTSGFDDSGEQTAETDTEAGENPLGKDLPDPDSDSTDTSGDHETPLSDDSPDREAIPEEVPEDADPISKDTAELIAENRQRAEEAEERADRLEPLGPENPLDLDPRIGEKDIAFDRAKPGARVYVVDTLATSVPDYYERFPSAPDLSEYAGNVAVRFRDSDAVLACVYIKDSLTSVDTNLTAYPMPESRLTRYPAEEADLVGGRDREETVEFKRTALPEDA